MPILIFLHICVLLFDSLYMINALLMIEPNILHVGAILTILSHRWYIYISPLLKLEWSHNFPVAANIMHGIFTITSHIFATISNLTLSNWGIIIFLEQWIKLLISQDLSSQTLF